MKISGSKRVKTVPKLKARARDVHKGDCGRVLLVAGSEGMLGAAMLCASAALRGGAGLVRAALPKPLMTPFTIAVPPATTVPRTPASLKRALSDADAVVLATGGFQSNLDMVREFWPQDITFPERILAGSGRNSIGLGHRLAATRRGLRHRGTEALGSEGWGLGARRRVG